MDKYIAVLSEDELGASLQPGMHEVIWNWTSRRAGRFIPVAADVDRNVTTLYFGFVEGPVTDEMKAGLKKLAVKLNEQLYDCRLDMRMVGPIIWVSVAHTHCSARGMFEQIRKIYALLQSDEVIAAIDDIIPDYSQYHIENAKGKVFRFKAQIEDESTRTRV